MMWALCWTKGTGLHPLPADDVLAKNRHDFIHGAGPQVSILLVGDRSTILRAMNDAIDDKRANRSGRVAK